MNPIEVLGYAPETSIAEKCVTILERGVTSTRWRDYIDIVQLAQNGVNTAELRRSAEAVAQYRKVTLEPVSRHLDGYGSVGQVSGPPGDASRSWNRFPRSCPAITSRSSPGFLIPSSVPGNLRRETDRAKCGMVGRYALTAAE